MNNPNLTPEQQQLIVEMMFITINIKKQENGGSAELRDRAGAKEKAAKIDLPEQSYAELQPHVASHNAKTNEPKR